MSQELPLRNVSSTYTYMLYLHTYTYTYTSTYTWQTAGRQADRQAGRHVPTVDDMMGRKSDHPSARLPAGARLLVLYIHHTHMYIRAYME